MEQSLDNLGPEAVIQSYREAYEAGATGMCESLRRAWMEWQGEDNLHEMAFGEPVE